MCIRDRLHMFAEETKSRAERMAEFRERNAAIEVRNLLVRDAFLDSMRQERDKRSSLNAKARSEKRQQWNNKLRNSPFTVDLLAENERQDQELRVRLKHEARQMRLLAKKKSRVKSDIILKALAEGDELSALRAEKRALVAEEKRLRALRDLEKVSASPAELRRSRAAQRTHRELLAEEQRTLRRERLGLVYGSTNQRTSTALQGSSRLPAHLNNNSNGTS
eukprot:TRINITY_DN21484_c0_g1_i1.p1 TRINITY_DN21484_c0_g1~~TRINITY_DN21484_c0_g1_i1.p1  ORF type:complete len:221 (+),score=78.47 TRINITY_DN21484_c0_g1_i1:155-817(+)